MALPRSGFCGVRAITNECGGSGRAEELEAEGDASPDRTGEPRDIARLRSRISMQPAQGAAVEQKQQTPQQQQEEPQQYVSHRLSSLLFASLADLLSPRFRPDGARDASCGTQPNSREQAV